MTRRIESIRRVSHTSSRIEPVQGYTKAEKADRLAEVAQANADRAELRAYLSQFPQTNGESFAELLKKASEPEREDIFSEDGYILDVLQHV